MRQVVRAECDATTYSGAGSVGQVTTHRIAKRCAEVAHPSFEGAGELCSAANADTQCMGSAQNGSGYGTFLGRNDGLQLGAKTNEN